MLQAITDRARAVSPDRSQGDKLKFIPILGRSYDRPPYELLRPETLDLVRVTETSHEASVPELQVENGLDVPVFLMDGQELIGAKQNRILNTDVMVPAKSTLRIPVSCVEQGRWSHVSPSFSSGKSASHRMRSAKLARVHASLKSEGRHDADQRAVWNEVAMCLSLSRSSSPTGALSAAYAQRETELREFRGSLNLPPEAVGLAAFHAGRFQGLDLFDRHATLRHFWDTLVDSYTIDLLDAPIDAPGTDSAKPDAAPESPAHAEPDEGRTIRSVLEHAVAGHWEAFDPPGEGKEWRMRDRDLAAAALVCGDEVVIHLQVFPNPGNPDGTAGGVTPATRPRIRRR